MSFADCAVIRLPAAERPLCPPPGPRIAASLYIWNANSPVLAMPTGRFSARTNHLALAFALRAIAAQPADYAAAVAHDFSLSFYWDRPVHPDAAIVNRYQFADATTAWVPPTLWTPGGGTLAGDQAVQQRTSGSDPRGAAVRLLAGDLPAVRLPAGDAARRDPARGAGRDGHPAPGQRTRAAVGVRGDDPAGAAASRRLRPALPGARGARRLPGRGAGVRAGSGSAQVDDVPGGHRDLGARGHPDQQPAVRVDAGDRAGDRLTAGEFGPDGAADRGRQPGVFGAQPAAVRVAAGPLPGAVPVLELSQDGEEQAGAVQRGRSGCTQGRGGQRAGAG